MTKTQATYTDGMGFTDDEWERMWNSETATSTVHRASDDDEDAWQEAYDRHFAANGDEDAAIDYADAKVYG